MEAKQQLIELIEAYATARATNNEILVKMSATTLQDFLNRYDLVVPELSEIKKED
jgi:hypothetical protein